MALILVNRKQDCYIDTYAGRQDACVPHSAFSFGFLVAIKKKTVVLQLRGAEECDSPAVVQKIPLLLWNPKVPYLVHKIPKPAPMLKYFNTNPCLLSDVF